MSLLNCPKCGKRFSVVNGLCVKCGNCGFIDDSTLGQILEKEKGDLK